MKVKTYGLLIYFFVFGDPSHFKDAAKTEPKAGDLMGTVFTGGYLVAILIGLTLMVVTFIVERLFSLSRAQGRGNLSQFLRRVHDLAVLDAEVDAIWQAPPTLERIRSFMTSLK